LDTRQRTFNFDALVWVSWKTLYKYIKKERERNMSFRYQTKTLLLLTDRIGDPDQC
jgi:hypothetical protein